ncbi:hypothetical protein Zmor_016966 [Zophobas morio]|uniref:Protein takeout n=1 Tax=Zophobas morio TaxID=2755281 RepID=A0AA38IAH4_9CUCU|nr:hypothetical protein Zmor_016966 [Zophobas morio]
MMLAFYRSTIKTVLAFLLLLVSTQAAKFPPNFKKCNRKDPNSAKCILEAAQFGVLQANKNYPQIGLANLAPLEIVELKIGAGSHAVVNVDQNFKNCKLYGFEKAKIRQFEFDFEEKVLRNRGTVPEVKMLCEYELNGKVLLLPIVGTGPSTVILKNLQITAHFEFEYVTLDPEFVSFNFENLFNGDKQLGDNINKVLNDNFKEVYADVQQGYEKGLGLIIQQILNNLFSKVSMDEAFD